MSNLIVQLNDRIQDVSDILEQILSTDYPQGTLTDAAAKIAKELVSKDGRLSVLKRRAGDAKKKLDDIRPRKKPRKNKPKRDEEEDEQDATEFWSDPFIEDLKLLGERGLLEPSEFLSRLMTKRADNLNLEMGAGLKLVMQGVDSGLSEDQLEQTLDAYEGSEVVSRALKELRVGELSEEDLAAIYMETHPEEKSALKERCTAELFQTAIASISAAQFACHWDALENSVKEKQAAIDAIFRAQYNVEDIDREGDKWNGFKTKHRAYVRAANRLIRALKIFGCLVLICPQLSFAHIGSTNMGNNLSQTIKALSSLKTSEACEAKHRKFVVELFRSKHGDPQLVAAFIDLAKHVWGVEIKHP